MLIAPSSIHPASFFPHPASRFKHPASRTLLDSLIQSRTRIRLLTRFFLNPEQGGYLRGLEKELGENSNALRVELNRFEESGLVTAEWKGHRKWFFVNRDFPLFAELHSIAMKHFGIDQVIDRVLRKIGPVDAVYLVGGLASGLDSPTVEVLIFGRDIHTAELDRLIAKAEPLIGRTIRCDIREPGSMDAVPLPSVRLI